MRKPLSKRDYHAAIASFDLEKIRDNPGSEITVFQTAFAKLNIISK